MHLRASRLFAATALSLSLAPLVQAEDADAADRETVVVTSTYLYSDQVTALRSPTPIIDVPQSLSVVSAEQIAEQAFDSIGDIIAYTPGVSTSQGEGHRDAVVFRGVRSTADFFVDGVRDDVQYYRPLYNLEQVEILRGPNALLFGRGGTGGVLNRVTKKGQLGDQFTDYRTSIDSFGAFDVQLDTNLPISDGAALRINGFYESLANHRDFHDGDRFGVNPTSRFSLGASSTLDLSYEFIDYQHFIDRGIPTGADGRPVEALKDVVFGDAELNTAELEAHVLRANLQHQFSDTLKGVFSASYGDYDKLYQNFYASAYNPATNIVTLDGYLDTTQRQNLVLSGSLVGEFTTGPFGHTVVSGIEYIDTTNNNDRFNSFFDQSADDTETFFANRPIALFNGVGVNANGAVTTNDFTVDLNDDTAAEVEVYSVFIQDEIELSPNFDLVIGARFDSFDISVLNVPANDVRSRKDEEISPRLGLVYKPQENISVYASYSESFLPRSGEQFTDINGANDQLDPDTFSNLEAGVKLNFTQRLSFTASIFEIEQSSPQVSDSDPSTLDVIDSQITGFEAQLQGQLTDQWYLSAGYSNLDGEQVSRTGPTGLRPRELPEHMFSLWNAYEVTDRFGLGLGLSYQDDTFIDNGNNAILPGYTRVDASAYYDINEDFRVQLNVENLTDEIYFPHAHSTHQVSVGAPINARLTLRGRF